ncbi:uncharacterized protein DSM5745_06350 [Aspergillus mulundensis]|uniref:Uncharacterized protein n=1 Tax=Aspergillus mulundensis TaxID=1810919 RepID=A0A3D8RQY2_9EURO|nr:Uncharacterized protein DSM5745_06350 [Aspergillus mulundensis]RDW76358.1 Uncharacterized protein DSM5745_06350 [Aspergillus mulundensis]
MSFTSFSTSVLYDERSDSQEAVETADPGSGNHLSISLDSASNDPSKYPHAIHEVAKRDPPSKPNNSKPSGQGKQSNGTKPDPVINQTATPVVKDWKHEKASVAASSIFAVVALAALVLLSWTIVKKIRARQRRKKGVDNDSLDERRARREAMMFSKCHSAGSYMVEEEKDGKVIRVFCTSRNKLCTISPRTSTGQLPLEQINSALSMKAEATRHMEDLGITQRGRRGSIPKQIVVVSSPLQPAVSRTAVPQVSEPAEAHMASISNELEAECPRTPAHSPTSTLDQESEEAEISPRHSFRKSLLRLPSITQTMSPLWRL